MARRYDLDDDSVVVVVGSGAGGGVIANELAQKGVDVVCLEAGRVIPLEEIETNAEKMFAKLTWLDPRIGAGDMPKDFPVWSGKGVGGTTMHWTANLVRMQAHEFRPRSTYGKLPGTNAIDWPIALDDLAPYYDKAEFKLGATGTNGWPMLPEGNNFKVMKAGGRRVGYRRINNGTMAINSVFRDDRPACQQLGFCKSGCAIDAKWTTANSEIPKALATGHFELRPNSMVLQVLHNRSGRISGVLYADADGNHHVQKARVVVLAANAIDTPRLLLNSASGMYPVGLANSSGQVGRNYMRHVFGFVLAIMPGEVNFYRTTQNAGVINDERPFRPERGFAGGYEFEGVGLDPAAVARFMAPGRWGRDYTADLEAYRFIAGMLIVGEDPADYRNGIILHGRKKDSYGLPVPVVRYEEHANSRAMRAHAFRQGRAIFEALGARKVYTAPPVAATHNMGTCRMSKSPRDGVCNQWGRTHDIANLFIADGSLMTSSGGGNPTLTIIALAIRQADYLAERLRRGEL